MVCRDTTCPAHRGLVTDQPDHGTGDADTTRPDLAPCCAVDVRLAQAQDDLRWVVFDIDGTVSDCRHRQPYLDREVPDWEAFFAAASADAPLAEGVGYALRRAQDGHLLWLTGRPERYRDMTLAWLHAHGLPTTHLHMRPDDDMRPAAVFKAERIQHIAAAGFIQLIVDDDEQVIGVLRAAGWPVQHATWMSI